MIVLKRNLVVCFVDLVEKKGVELQKSKENLSKVSDELEAKTNRLEAVKNELIMCIAKSKKEFIKLGTTMSIKIMIIQ